MKNYGIVIMILLMAGVAQAIGLVGYWNFEEGGPLGAGAITTDKSGVNPLIPLTLQADAQIVYDPNRASYVLDPRPGYLKNLGSGGAFGALDSGSKLDTPKVFTLSIWVKPRAVDANEYQGYEEQWASIISDDSSDSNRHNLRSMNSGLLFVKEPLPWESRLDIWRGASWDPTDVDDYDGTGPWHHLLVTSDGYNFYGYIDGVLRGTKAFSPAVFQKMYLSWKIGAQTTHRIDDVAMFNGYCPAASASGLYDGTYTVSNVPLLDYVPAPATCNGYYAGDPNLLAWYHFEEGPGAATTADLASDFPAANATRSVKDDPFGCPGPYPCPPKVAEIIFDSSTTPFQPPLQVGNVFNAKQFGSSIGTYFYASGAKFNGVNNYDPGNPDTAPNAFIHEGLSKGFTLSAWIKPADDHINWGEIVTKGGWDGMFVLYMEKNGLHSLIRYAYKDEYGWNGIGGEGLQVRGDSQDNILTVGVWQHVAMVWDPNTVEGSEMKFYVNGWRESDSGVSVETPNGTKLVDVFPAEPFMIGNPFQNTPLTGPDIIYKAFRGPIDDVRLYNRPLSDAEIACLWKRTCVSRLIDGDFAGDCAVNMSDMSALSASWQAPYDIDDLVDMASNWLESDLVYPVY